MEPPPTDATAPPADKRRISDGGIPRSNAKIISQSDKSVLPIPVSVTTFNAPNSRIPPHVSGSLRNRERLSEAGIATPSINLSGVKDQSSRNIAGVSPKRIMKAPASPSSASIINSLRKDSKAEGGILRTISSRTTEAWDRLEKSVFLEKYKALSRLERINVGAILSDTKFEWIKEEFQAACKKSLPKLSSEDRKLLIDLFTRKTVFNRIGLLVQSEQLNSYQKDIEAEELLRNKTLLLVRQTDATDQLKGHAQHFTSYEYPLEKILRLIVSEQKDDALNARLLRFGVYLIESADPEMAIHYGPILFNFLDRHNDNPQKPRLLVELRAEMAEIMAKKKSTYLAGQLVRELCFKCQDDHTPDPHKLSNTEQLIFDIAYGYFRFTKLDKLLSILSMAYIGVTTDWSKRVLMLKLMIELLRITPPQHLDQMTQAYLSDAIESAATNMNNEIKREGLELKRVYERFLLESATGVLPTRNPRLLRMPSASNIQAERVAKSLSPFTQELKWDVLINDILKGLSSATSLVKISHDIKNEMLRQLRQVTVPELVEKKWEMGSVASMAQHAQFCDKFSYFIMGAILQQENVSGRAKVIEFFIELLSVVTQFHDYASGYVIFSALDNSCIERLNKTWKKVSPNSKEKWDNLKKFFDLTKSNVKEAIRDLKDESFTIPMMKLRMDVAHNSERYSSMDGTNLNFNALKHLSDIIYHFLKCIKNKPDEKSGTDFIQCVNKCAFTDDQLRKLSHERESGKNLKEKIGSAISRKP